MTAAMTDVNFELKRYQMTDCAVLRIVRCQFALHTQICKTNEKMTVECSYAKALPVSRVDAI